MSSHMRPVCMRNSLITADVEQLDITLTDLAARRPEIGEECLPESSQARITVEPVPDSERLTLSASILLERRGQIECRFRVVTHLAATASCEMASHPQSLEVIKQLALPAIDHIARQALAMLDARHQIAVSAAPRPARVSLLRCLLGRDRRRGDDGRRAQNR